MSTMGRESKLARQQLVVRHCKISGRESCEARQRSALQLLDTQNTTLTGYRRSLREVSPGRFATGDRLEDSRYDCPVLSVQRALFKGTDLRIENSVTAEGFLPTSRFYSDSSHPQSEHVVNPQVTITSTY